MASEFPLEAATAGGPLRGWRLVCGGIWAGFLAGAAEGVVLALSRAVPTILAPYKVPLDVLWIAPVANAVVFGAIAALLSLLSAPWRQRFQRRVELLLVGILTFGALAIPLITLEVLYLPSALLLAVGLAVAVTRAFGARLVAASTQMQRRIALVPAGVVVMALLTAGYERGTEWQMMRALPAAATGAKNVLVLVLDTVRRDRFARELRGRLTPNIDSLLGAGTWYRQAWSTSSWSLPSQASILTGLYPHQHQADWPDIGMSSTIKTLPEVLAENGYATGAFSGNAAWIVPEHVGRGFARFEVYRVIDVVQRLVGYRTVKPVLRALGFHDAGFGKQAPALRSSLLRFVDDYRDRPFFAYVCMMDVNQALHRRMLSHPAWEEDPNAAKVLAAYDSALRKVDDEIGTMLSELRARGVLDNTMIVITSDHGESFGAEHAPDHEPTGHGSSLYPEQTRVPLTVVLPKGAGSPGVVDYPVSIRAIASTITQELGIPHAQRFGDPLPVYRSGRAPNVPDTPASALLTLRYAGTYEDALVKDRMFLLRRQHDSTETSELYDLTVDPRATRELDDDESERALESQLDRLLMSRAGVKKLGGTPRPSLGSE